MCEYLPCVIFKEDMKPNNTNNTNPMTIHETPTKRERENSWEIQKSF